MHPRHDCPVKIHTSFSPVTRVESTYDNLKPDLWPKGFWWACGPEWIKVLKQGEAPKENRTKEAFLYQVKIDDAQILNLDSTRKIKMLVEAYCHSKADEGVEIDWDKVARDYSGIEVSRPDLLERVGESLGVVLPGIKIRCGCVWDARAVTELIPNFVGIYKATREARERFAEKDAGG